VWERAARVLVADPPSEGPVEVLGAALRESGECAIEAFARDAKGHVAFCGVRFAEIERAEAMRVLHGLWHLAARGAELEEAVDWISARLGMAMFHAPCTAVEVGVVDAWRSLGAVRVFPAERPQVASDTSHVLLGAATRLPAPPNAIVAAEFASAGPLPHWAAVEIARTDGAGRLVPRAPARRAAAVLATLLRG
jgi:hypothetical protein